VTATLCLLLSSRPAQHAIPVRIVAFLMKFGGIPMNDVLRNLYQTVLSRKSEHREGSYTCYLFEQGLDKILKKCGEECSEVIIAAKNGKNADTVAEISDLLYHLTVLMVNEGISPEEIEAELNKRSQKTGNLKKFHQVDKNS
jgi:phosphoribosyl-ATP pyrophosphohydrolase